MSFQIRKKELEHICLKVGILCVRKGNLRYQDLYLQLHERICPVCDSAVEDEIHFLCECPLYSHIRSSLFELANADDSNFCSMDLLDKFVYLMSNQQRNVMKYLSKAVPLRTDCLYN